MKHELDPSTPTTSRGALAASTFSVHACASRRQRRVSAVTHACFATALHTCPRPAACACISKLHCMRRTVAPPNRNGGRSIQRRERLVDPQLLGVLGLELHHASRIRQPLIIIFFSHKNSLNNNFCYNLSVKQTFKNIHIEY